jgi:hypothetical protein
MGILQASKLILDIIPPFLLSAPPPTKSNLPAHHPLHDSHPSSSSINHSMHHARLILPRPGVLKTLCSTPFNAPPQPLTSLLNALTTVIYTTHLPPYYQCFPHPSILDLGCNDTYLDQFIDDDASSEAAYSVRYQLCSEVYCNRDSFRDRISVLVYLSNSQSYNNVRGAFQMA